MPMIKKLLTLILFSCGAMMLTSCAPIYQTTYSYTQPKTQRGAQCIVVCKDDFDVCQNNCEASFNACLSRSEDHESRNLNRAIKNNQVYSPGDDYCPGSCGCTASYNVCYLVCGGNVSAKTTCISNCKKTQH